MMRRIPALALVGMIAASGSASGTSIFSYHQQGLGYWEWRGDGRIMGMGGASVAVFDMSNPISVNPAVISAFEQTSLTATFLSQKREALDYKGLRGTFYDQYPRIFRAVVPLGYGIVMSVGLEPLSDVRMIWSSQATANGVSYRDSLEADGGLWAGTLQFARQFGPFAAGIRVQMVRGRIITEWRRTILDASTPLTTSVLSTRRFVGGTFGLGAVYRLGEVWTFGAALDVPTTLDETDIVSLGTRIPSSLYPSHSDKFTIVSSDQNDTSATTLKLPLGFALGASWRPGERLISAAEVEYRQWSQVSSEFRNTWRVALGAEIRPSTNFKSFFLLQWPYRLGLRWEQHYIPAQSTQSSRSYPNGWYVTTGLGIPIGAGLGQIDYAFEYGQRGSLGTNLARERVWRQTISIVGWDRWFVRRPRR